MFKGKVIIGNGGAEYGVRGYITAHDATSGARMALVLQPGDPSKPFEDESMRPPRPGIPQVLGKPAAAAPPGTR